MKPGWWVAGLLGVVVLGAGGWYWRERAEAGPAIRVPDATAPDSVRIRVQVLNATHVNGLARRATFYLRDHGYDVVLIGNSPDQHDSSVVIDRSGHPRWAADVARTMGNARVEAQPDSTLYVDVTVLVGRSWRPPARPFYP